MTDFDDDLIGKRLYDQIVYEIHNDRIRNERFWVCVCRTNGEVRSRKFGLIFPELPQILYAQMACRMMNAKVRHDGTWIVVWFAPDHAGVPTRLMFLWKDRDGDVPATYITEAGMLELVKRGPEWACEMGAGVIKRYREFLRNADIKPEQMIKAAQGQKSVNPNVGPSL